MRAVPLVVVAMAILIFFSSTSANQVITQDLSKRIEDAGERDLIRVCIKAEGRLDLQTALEKVADMTKKERREFAIGELKRIAHRSHAPILSILEKEQREGNVGRVRSLWLAKVVAAEVTKSVIGRLADSPSVVQIDLDRYENALIQGPDNTNEAPLMPDTVWNIELVDAPCAWQQGYTGSGVVVGHFDTGENYNHLDLADHLWINTGETPNNGIDDDGNGYIDDYYGYDFANTDSDPIDDNGHGTHTAGTVAGDGTAGRNTGVAPDARIMSLKVLDWQGWGLQSDAWEAIQYSLLMDADVLTFSIGWLHYYDPNRQTWRGLFDGVLLAGVNAAVAAGNEKEYWFYPWWLPPPDNVRTPGDVPPPWLHPDQALTGGLSGVVTAGATDISDNIADFSSEGPVTWESISPYLDYPHTPEMGLLDPDVCAPGVSITSLRHNSNNGYVGGASWSGTSMATPHVAGLMALMLSKNPDLTPAQIDSIIETTALELGSPGKDNEYGAGRIRACDAINATPTLVEEELSQRDRLSRPILKVAPNPFRTKTTITIALQPRGEEDTDSPGVISLYDLGGRLIKRFEVSPPAAGQVEVVLSWDGKGENGKRATGGIYFLKVQTETEAMTRKLILLR